MNTLAATQQSWANFYLIIGSAAAALTGLMFVVVSLRANQPRQTNTTADHSYNAFATPTVFHFAVVALLAALIMMPVETELSLILGVVAVALGGMVHLGFAYRHTRHIREYQPVVSDWWWYFVAPAFAYVVMLTGAVWMRATMTTGLTVVAISALLLLFNGIRNAWDSATYLASTPTQ